MTEPESSLVVLAGPHSLGKRARRRLREFPRTEFGGAGMLTAVIVAALLGANTDAHS